MRVRTSVLAFELGTQCPDLVADATADTRPKVILPRESAESKLPLWDRLLQKRRAIERHEQSLQEARRRLKDPDLLSHEVDFFATAEAEAREKVRCALEEFWALNVPDPARRVALREQARQTNHLRAQALGSALGPCGDEPEWSGPRGPARVLLGPRPTSNRLTFAAVPTNEPTTVTVTLRGDRESKELVGGRVEQVREQARKARLDEPPAPRVVALLERGGPARKFPPSFGRAAN